MWKYMYVSVDVKSKILSLSDVFCERGTELFQDHQNSLDIARLHGIMVILVNLTTSGIT